MTNVSMTFSLPCGGRAVEASQSISRDVGFYRGKAYAYAIYHDHDTAA
jgi:hypothetical protein